MSGLARGTDTGWLHGCAKTCIVLKRRQAALGEEAQILLRAFMRHAAKRELADQVSDPCQTP